MAPTQPTSSAPAPHSRYRPPRPSTTQPTQSLQPHQSDPPPSLQPPIQLPSSTSLDGHAARRLSRKLQKRRYEDEHTPTMELPERLKDHGDQSEEEEEVVQAQGYGGGVYMNMNQSIFGLIAAAGTSGVDFTDRFEGQSSDEEDGADQHPLAKTIAGHRGSAGREGLTGGLRGPLSHTTVLSKKSITAGSKGEGSHHRRKISESKLLRSVPGLSKLTSKSKSYKREKGSESSLRIENNASPTANTGDSTQDIDTEVPRPEGRLAPVMSRMLEARAEMAARPSFDLDRLSGEQSRTTKTDETGPTELAKRLKEIFEFDTAEEVIEEYPCWLLQHVLLQGYMYITSHHIAFYAYLPKKAHEVAKSGYLSKSGKRNPKYNRYWFRLKGDVLSYYRDPQNLYFPSGHIDLRYGISASVTDKEKDAVHFTVTTDHRTYNLKADSAQSAKEWVKSLQRVIFRSHNDGDSVKISLPIKNVIDIEETQMLGFADTCKIRVIDNDETYAIDEYFFSFFTFGKDAIKLLRILVGDSSADASNLEEASANEASSKRTSTSGNQDQTLRPSTRDPRANKLSEGVKATLAPVSPTRNASSASPRASGDFTRSSFDAFRSFGRRSLEASQNPPQESLRRSFSGTRRSFSKNRHGRDEYGHVDEKPGSSDSYVQSFGDPSQASISALMVASGTTSSGGEDQAPASASQILRGSDVFHSPTVPRRSLSASRVTKESGRESAPPVARHHSSGLGKYSATHAATTGHVADPGAGEHGQPQDPETTPTLQSIAKMGGFPLQKANAIMGYLDRTSRRMSTLLATESMGYVEKVSGMWKGGKKHYDDHTSLAAAGLKTDDEAVMDGEGPVAPEERAESERRFQQHFALPETEKLQAAYFGYLMRVLPLYGKIYIGNRHICFRSLLPGTRTKLILPLRDIETADKEKGFRFGYAGLVVVIRGHEELFFEFSKGEDRDDCAVMIIQSLEAQRYLGETEAVVDKEELEDAALAVAERDALREARGEEFPDHEVQLPRAVADVGGEVPVEAPTILFDDPKASFLNFKPTHSMRITCLTIGSRGDVQPYIALCKRLLEEGHKPKIATHVEFKDWVESHGIEFGEVFGDPSELMRLCIENGTFTLAFMKEANSKFRGWLDDLLASAWRACQGSELLIESPSAMAGIHIAEALGIPYFRAFTMPWTRTRAYPHAFIMPGQKMGGAYNYITYVMFDNVFWKAMAPQVNRWRNNMLGLPNTNLEKLAPNKVPFLYNFSPYVVPPPLDFSDWIRVTGYWFLDEGNGKWEPPRELVDFINKARADGKKLVYVGFGSIIVPDPAKMTQEVIDAVLKADVRCILSKGWSDRIGPEEDQADRPPEPELPEEIFQIKSAPHDWLFRQIDAAAHHGGSGTTGASLRAGIPTIIRPWFGDQFFFGSRVEDLGVGICLKKWGAHSFAKALWEATHSERMIVKARVLGEQIRAENGVDVAIQCIYRDLEYATNLIKAKQSRNMGATRRRADSTGVKGTASEHKGGATTDGDTVDGDADDVDEDDEESWTFVGGDAETVDELSPDRVVKRTIHGDLSSSGVGLPSPTADVVASGPGAANRALGSRVIGGGGAAASVRK